MKILMLLCCALFLSCNTPKKEGAKTFYDFDKVEYTELMIDAASIAGYTAPPNPSERDTVKENLRRFIGKLIIGGLPEKPDDSIFWKSFSAIKKSGFTIDEKYYGELRSKILTEKKCTLPTETAAVLPIYTGFLIFRKDNKITGILALNSFRAVFSGAENNTDCFGLHGEIEALSKIINHPQFLK